MKRLNPLYLISLFLTLSFISYFMLSNTKDEFTNKVKEYENVQAMANEYKTLSSNWSNEKYVEENLNRILKNRLFSKLKIEKTKTNKYIALKVYSKQTKTLDKFLNKMLNKPFVIRKLELKKDFVNLEIGIR